MKLLDKLKNALFEEEYVEVEEKPKKKEVKREKVKKEKTIKKATNHHEEKPIAKKIVPKKEKEPEIVNEKKVKEDHTGEILAYDIEKEEKNFKFNMVSDEEFEVKEPKNEEKEITKEDKLKRNIEKKLYQGKKKEKKPYGIEEINIPETEYGAYEKKEDRTYFRPSPIISPIYGILDKNYTKDEIMPKKEIRLTSAYNRESINVDEVRKKAFGTLSNDLDQKLEDYSYEEEDMDQDAFLDLSSDEDTPEVKKVTMGDAEEYFEDLGLEYNVDYKDTSKEKASGRRTRSDHQELEHEKEDVSISDTDEIEDEIKLDNEEDSDDDNLFDLIDSMYDKE